MTLYRSLPQAPLRERLAVEAEPSAAGVLDPRRRRPRYFAGRALAAADLLRDQSYVLDRQSLIGRALGSGVASGLQVEVLSATRLRLRAGHGLTPAGELVSLASNLEVDLGELPEAQAVDVRFGLRLLPQTPTRGRSGLFVLALHPLELLTDPDALLAGGTHRRFGLSDDVADVTGISLIRHTAGGPEGEAGVQPLSSGRLRARLARDFFLRGEAAGIAAGVLPLALLELERGVLRWLDLYLVRRDLTGAGGAARGVGPLALQMARPTGSSAAAREAAHSRRAGTRAALLQYAEHLEDVVAQRRRGNRPPAFAAREYFEILPAAGPLPAGVIAAAPAGGGDLAETFFPPEIDVELSVVPEDEVAQLVEDALALPPIDLGLPAAELASVAVLVVIPVPRRQLPAVRQELERAQAIQAVALAKSPEGAFVTPPLFGSTNLEWGLPVATLRLDNPRQAVLRLSQPRFQAPPAPPATVHSAWQRLIAAAPILWYLRRRSLPRTVDVMPIAPPLREADQEISPFAERRLRRFGQLLRWRALWEVTTAEAVEPMSRLLEMPALNHRLTLEGTLVFLQDLGRVTGGDVAYTRRHFEQIEEIRTVSFLIGRHGDFLDTRKYSDPLAQTGLVLEILHLYTLLQEEPAVLTETQSRLTQLIDANAPVEYLRHEIITIYKRLSR